MLEKLEKWELHDAGTGQYQSDVFGLFIELK